MVSKIMAIEMWLWKRIVRSKWIEKRMSGEIVANIIRKRDRGTIVSRRQWGFMGNDLRRAQR